MILTLLVDQLFFYKNGPYPASFSHRMDKYSTNLTINDKSVYGMLGSRTRGGRMEGADKSTELWRHPLLIILFIRVNRHLKLPFGFVDNYSYR